jgi:hypothetical protein
VSRGIYHNIGELLQINKKFGVESFEVSMAKKFGATIIREEHGSGDRFSDYTPLIEVLSNPSQYNGEIIYLESCQNACARISGQAIPNQYVVDWSGDDPTIFNVLNPTQRISLTPEEVISAKGGKLILNPEKDLALTLDSNSTNSKVLETTTTTSANPPETQQPNSTKPLWEKAIRGRNGELAVADALKNVEAPSTTLTRELLKQRQQLLQNFFVTRNTTPAEQRLGERIARYIDDFSSLLDSTKPLTKDDLVQLVQGENLLSRNTLNFVTDLKQYDDPVVISLGEGIIKDTLELGRAAWNKATPEQRVYILKEAGYDVVDAVLSRGVNQLAEIPDASTLPNLLSNVVEPVVEKYFTDVETFVKKLEAVIAPGSTSRASIEAKKAREDLEARRAEFYAALDTVKEDPNNIAAYTKLAGLQLDAQQPKPKYLVGLFNDYSDRGLAAEVYKALGLPKDRVPERVVAELESLKNKDAETRRKKLTEALGIDLKTLAKESDEDARRDNAGLIDRLRANEGLIPANIALAKKQGADTLLIMHGFGRTASDHNFTREVLTNDYYKGKTVLGITCQNSCVRYTGSNLPTEFIWKRNNDDSLEVWSILNSNYKINFTPEVVSRLRDIYALPYASTRELASAEALENVKTLPALGTIKEFKEVVSDAGYRLITPGKKNTVEALNEKIETYYKPSLVQIESAIKQSKTPNRDAFLKTLSSIQEAIKSKDFTNLPKNAELDELMRFVDEELPGLDSPPIRGVITNSILLQADNLKTGAEYKDFLANNPLLARFLVREGERNKTLRELKASLVEDLILGGGDATPGNLNAGSKVSREPLSRQNISDALRMANSQGGAVDEVLTQVPGSQQLNVRKRRDPNAALPTTVGQAVKEFKDALAQVNRTGVMDDRTQIKLNNAVFAMESLDDKSYARKMREVVARLTGRTADEGKPFMSAAVELLNDPTKSWSREQVADILSYAIGTKDVKFAQNLDDAEVLKFGRLVAQRPEVYSQFDHVYVGHGTGIVEHGTWSLEARPSAGYGKRELIQHVIDNEYPRGTEVGVSACETGCPKRIQDAVPPMHRVVSRGAVGNTLDNLQRLVEELSALPVPTKIMDVFAQYDGLLREAMSANKQRSLEILQEMSDIEDDFNAVNKKYKFKSEQQVRAKMKQAQDAIEKDLLGDC